MGLGIVDTKSQRDNLILEGLTILNKEAEIFVNRYMLRRFMSKEDIEDMKSDCIIEIINKIESYDPTKAKLGTYLGPRIKGSFKDFLRKQDTVKKGETKYFIETFHKEIVELFSLDSKGVTVFLKNLKIPNEHLKEICFNISDDDSILNYHLFESLIDLPDKRIYILLGYYILDKNIKELADELDLSAKSGWIYKLKRDSLKYLKETLTERGYL